MQNIKSNQSLVSANELKIEKRAYHEDSTPEEIALLRTRIFIHEENIIFYDEIPVVCPFSINILFQKTEEVADELDQCGLIIDISNTLHPDAPTRKVINQRFERICDKVSHVAFVTGKNVLINTAIRFVLFGTNLDSFSINKDVTDAVPMSRKI